MRPRRKRKRVLILAHTGQKVLIQSHKSFWVNPSFSFQRGRWEQVIKGRADVGTVVLLKRTTPGYATCIVTSRIKIVYYPEGSYKVCYDYWMFDYFISQKPENYLQSKIEEAKTRGYILSENLLLCQIIA